MKKINKNSLLFFLLIGIFTAQAQNSMDSEKTNTVVQSFYKHEIGVSCGLFAAPLVIPMYHGLFPSLNLSYYYNINKYHAIGVTLSSFFEGVYYFRPRHQHYNFQITGIILTPQINYRISYCQKKIISLYSLVSLGWKIPIGGKEFRDDMFFLEANYFPAVHVTFMGMRIGNQQDAATIEVGYGTHGSIILGYSHKFMSKKQ
jgi:hypothetical protein